MCPTKIRKFVMLNNGLIIDNIYQIISEIGSGGMGVIYLGYHLRLRKYIVLKKLKDSRKDIRQLRNEVDILKGLHHSYLPQVYDFINYNGSVYTVIDYIEGYDLKYYIDNNYQITEGQLIKWLRQLCEVLDYLHSHNPQVLHSDIKPANIIITTSGDYVKLIDFGLSDTESILTGKDPAGTWRYAAPEILAGERADESCDIYSLGIIIKECSGRSFSGIARRCTAHDKSKRYASASDVKKAFINNGKRWIWAVVSAIAIFAAGAGILYYSNRENSVERLFMDAADVFSPFRSIHGRTSGKPFIMELASKTSPSRSFEFIEFNTAKRLLP